MFALDFPYIFTGSLYAELLFSWPGMGRALYNAILARDYPVVMAASFLFGVLVLGANLLADLLYAVIDPRIRTD
jgi:peptide/nickel transport system permease protein